MAIETKIETEKDEKLGGDFNALKGELLLLSAKNSKKYISWFLKKLTINRHHYRERYIKGLIKEKPDNIQELKRKLLEYKKKNFPHNLKSGEIIYVKYGIGIGDEIQDGHYSVILSRIGEMFLVAPLTSKKLLFGKNTLFFENLDLPNETGEQIDKSYVSFSQIRYIHSRRIERINNIPQNKEGRIDLKEKYPKAVDNILQNYNNIIINGIEK